MTYEARATYSNKQEAHYKHWKRCAGGLHGVSRGKD